MNTAKLLITAAMITFSSASMAATKCKHSVSTGGMFANTNPSVSSYDSKVKVAQAASSTQTGTR